MSEFSKYPDLTGRKKVFHVLGQPRGNTAPLAETLPDLHGIRRCLLLFSAKGGIHQHSTGGFSGTAVGGNTPPHGILHDQHTEFFQLLAQLLDVEADDTVVDIHVGVVVENVQRTLDVDFQRSRHMDGLPVRPASAAHCTDLPAEAYFRGGFSKYLR